MAKKTFGRACLIRLQTDYRRYTDRLMRVCMYGGVHCKLEWKISFMNCIFINDECTLLDTVVNKHSTNRRLFVVSNNSIYKF